MPPRFFIAAALGIVLAAPAVALTEADIFARIDGNADGTLSRKEFRAFRSGMFARIDADGDGLVTGDEIEAARGAMPKDSRIWSQDANGDGRLTLAEYTSQLRGFDRADRDGNGVVSADEFSRIARFLAAMKN